MHGIIKRIRRLPGMVFPAAVCLVLLSCGKGIGPYDNSKNPNTDMSASLSFDNDTAYQPGGDKSPESSDSFILEEAPATNAADNTSGINLQDSAVEPSSETYSDSMTVTDDSAQTVEPSVYEEAVTQSGAATATQTAGTEPTADTETEPELPEEKPFSLEKIAVTLKDGSKASFWIYTPKNASPGMPMIVYLHGGSGKGEDLELLMKSNSLPLYLRESRLGEIHAYIVMPQAGSDILGWRDEAATLIGLIDYCEESCGIDLDNVSLTGHSMGGTGTWELAVLYPERFARIAPMSGSVADTEENIAALKDMPVWAFVGARDEIVRPDSSIELVSSLKDAGGSARVTVFREADHFSVPELSYLNENLGLLDWLIGE